MSDRKPLPIYPPVRGTNTAIRFDLDIDGNHHVHIDLDTVVVRGRAFIQDGQPVCDGWVFDWRLRRVRCAFCREKGPRRVDLDGDDWVCRDCANAPAAPSARTPAGSTRRS